MEDGHCVRTNHAEANAICQAAKNGARLEGATIYVTASPCWPCFKLIASTGIKRIVFGELYRDERITGFAEASKIELLWLKPRAEKCGKCPACEIERHGCGCDGSMDDGCFLCTPERHKRPPCPTFANPCKEIPLGPPQECKLSPKQVPWPMTVPEDREAASNIRDYLSGLSDPSSVLACFGKTYNSKSMYCTACSQQAACSERKSEESNRWKSPMQRCRCGHLRREHKEIYNGHCDGVVMSGSGCDTEFDGCKCKGFEIGDEQNPVCFGTCVKVTNENCTQCGFANKCSTEAYKKGK